MKQKAILYTIFILTVSLCVSLFFNYKQYRDAQGEPAESVAITSETKTEVSEDKFVEPSPMAAEPIKTLSVKKHGQSKELVSGAEAESVSAIIPNAEETISETDSTYEVPITQKVYQDSTYTAWVSGFHASLDSIAIRHNTITNTIHETITKTKKQRITFGLQGGLYYTPKGLQPGIGIGIGYNF